MNLSISNKNALVCGGSKGIGFACACALGKLGANVTLLSRNEKLLLQAQEMFFIVCNTNCQIIAADLTNPDELRDILSNQPNKFDIIILNSGGPNPGELLKASMTDFLTIFNSFILSSQILLQANIDQMKSNNFGRLISIMSIGMKEPITGLGISNTIRGAVANWSKTLATELGPYGITVNNVLPGYTMTDRLDSLMKKRANDQGIETNLLLKSYLENIPARRFAHPNEIGDVVAFLASPAASYINGINLPVDGGYLKSL